MAMSKFMTSKRKIYLKLNGSAIFKKIIVLIHTEFALVQQISPSINIEAVLMWCPISQ